MSDLDVQDLNPNRFQTGRLEAANLFKRAYACLLIADPKLKVTGVGSLREDWLANKLDVKPNFPVETIAQPGRPQLPRLVHPRDVAKRKLNTDEGRASLVHAICHIEFNAINLALDAVYHFRDMPRDYYSDWLQVASEEAYHFGLLSARLSELGHVYGDFDAHNGLWEMAVKTQHDVLVRMALVPRVLEARGLDVTPGMIARLEQAGDQETVNILHIILRDEIGHVEIGTRWFRHLCAERKLNSTQVFSDLLSEYEVHTGKGSLHIEARKQAGFTEEELARLQSSS